MKPFFFIVLLSLIALTSCTGALEAVPQFTGTSQTQSVEKSMTPSPSPTGTFTLSPTPLPTLTPSHTPLPPTITPTPPQLSTFTTKQLRTGVLPVTYIEDTCSYLKNRWGDEKSTPGTIVVPIMFHSVAKPGRAVTNNQDITYDQFVYFMKAAKEMGFTTITVDDLIGFLQENERIPERSLLLILDDRRPGVTEEYFMPYLEEYDWTLTLAWLTTDNYPNVWDRMERLAETGRLDVQSHGHESEYIQDYMDVEIIERELFLPMALIEEHFGTIPQAHIWSGGNFTDRAVDIARDAGYKIGFTAFSRGPLMFNWVPLGEPERAVNDPLMVLPRYWSTDVDIPLIHALAISEEAKQAAEAVKEEELWYLTTYCQPTQGE